MKRKLILFHSHVLCTRETAAQSLGQEDDITVLSLTRAVGLNPAPAVIPIGVLVGFTIKRRESSRGAYPINPLWPSLHCDKLGPWLIDSPRFVLSAILHFPDGSESAESRLVARDVTEITYPSISQGESVCEKSIRKELKKWGYVRFGHLYVSQRQAKSTGVRGALGRARIDLIGMSRFASVASRPVVPALEQNQTSICSLGLRRAVAED